MGSNPVNGTLILVNPRPGERGSFKPNTLTGVGRFSLDMNMGKTIEFVEGKRLELRIDAENILNHATPTQGYTSYGARTQTINSPSLTVNTNASTPFGLLNTKTGHRPFQARVRFSFQRNRQGGSGRPALNLKCATSSPGF